MKKAIMIPIQPKWSKMIKAGLKEFEFRNYKIPKGMKVYIYEIIGKRLCGDYLNGYIHEGQGKVIAEFVVGEVHKLNFNNVLEMVFADNLSYNDIKQRGGVEYNYFTPEKEYYAMEITNLIVYDEEWQYDIGCNPVSMMRLNWLNNAPTSPLDISDFVGWNKFDKEVKRLLKLNPIWSYDELVNEVNANEVAGMDYKRYPLCNLTHAPQGKVYVVEKEETK